MGLYFRHPASFTHDTGAHPENAGRLRAIEQVLSAESFCGFEVMEAPAARREHLHRVHAARHVTGIEELSAAGGGTIDMDTVASPGSFEAAMRAAGGAVAAVDAVLGEGVDRAVCALRPPGHHATAERAMGFCLFNNAAVAAAHAIEEHGAERVLVLDWDVHHGNGTNDIFSASDSVLYASIHQSPCYPGTGPVEDTGRGDGEGFTLNMPVPPGSGSAVFESLVGRVAVPVIEEWEPSLVILSAGFDAHRADPLAECVVDTDSYGHMGAAVRRAADEVGARIVVCLEGGYDPGALAHSMVATLRGTQLGAEPRPAEPEPSLPYRRRFSRYWGSLR